MISPLRKSYFYKDENVYEAVALQRSEEHSRLRKQQGHRPQNRLSLVCAWDAGRSVWLE